MMIPMLFDRLLEFAKLQRHGVRQHARVYSHTLISERLTLLRLAKSLPQGARALEIGAHLGASTLFMCAGLSHVNGHLACVDSWMNETMPDGEKDTFAEFSANTRPYAEMITTIRKYSSFLTEEDIGGLLDLVFIDGDHSEEAVRGDFQLIAPWVKPGGYIAFHDLRQQYPGVHVVFGEALTSREWEIVGFEHSLGIIRRKEK